VYLDTELDEELKLERVSRELVSIIQKQRKDMNFDITDRISLNISTQEEFVISSIEKFKEYILNETLTTELLITDIKGSSKVLDYLLDTEIKQI
jgi:isoleucyl-tRNA synthetase